MKAEVCYITSSYVAAVYLTARGILPYGAEGRPGGPAKYRFPARAREVMSDLKAVRGVLDSMAALATEPDVDGWLREFLEGGPRTVQEVQAASLEQGYTRKSLDDAAHALGVVRRHDRPDAPWIWELPSEGAGQ